MKLENIFLIIVTTILVTAFVSLTVVLVVPNPSRIYRTEYKCVEGQQWMKYKDYWVLYTGPGTCRNELETPE